MKNEGKIESRISCTVWCAFTHANYLFSPVQDWTLKTKDPGEQTRRRRVEREIEKDELLHQENRNFPSPLLWLSRARHYYEHLHEGCEQGGLRMHFTLFLLLGKIMLFICLTAGLTSFSGQRSKERVSVWRSPAGPGEFCPQLLTWLKALQMKERT